MFLGVIFLLQKLLLRISFDKKSSLKLGSSKKIRKPRFRHCFTAGEKHRAKLIPSGGKHHRAIRKLRWKVFIWEKYSSWLIFKEFLQGFMLCPRPKIFLKPPGQSVLEHQNNLIGNKFWAVSLKNSSNKNQNRNLI